LGGMVGGIVGARVTVGGTDVAVGTGVGVGCKEGKAGGIGVGVAGGALHPTKNIATRISVSKCRVLWWFILSSINVFCIVELRKEQV
jgi:hypothetical protein